MIVTYGHNTPITLNTKTALQGRFLLFYIIHHLSLIVYTYPHPFGKGSD